MPDMAGVKMQKTQVLWQKVKVTHKVLQCVHITKQDDIVSQRHEAKGMEQSYQYFTEKDVIVKVHTHDRSMSFDKLVKDTHFTVNQNDSWHGVKSIRKAMKIIYSGSQYKEGQTWFKQLSDKEEPIATLFSLVHQKLRG